MARPPGADPPAAADVLEPVELQEELHEAAARTALLGQPLVRRNVERGGDQLRRLARVHAERRGELGEGVDERDGRARRTLDLPADPDRLVAEVGAHRPGHARRARQVERGAVGTEVGKPHLDCPLHPLPHPHVLGAGPHGAVRVLVVAQHPEHPGILTAEEQERRGRQLAALLHSVQRAHDLLLA
jgi:hypothetical protein